MNITSISGFLNSSTKAPNFVVELIQSSSKSLVLILDLPHRKDLVLNPDYLKEYYQDTALDSHRQSLLKLPEVNPYVSPSLFVRSAFSPTASMLKIDAEEEDKLEEILRDHVSPAAKEVLEVWLERCVKEEEEKIVVGEEERMELERELTRKAKHWILPSPNFASSSSLTLGAATTTEVQPLEAI